VQDRRPFKGRALALCLAVSMLSLGVSTTASVRPDAATLAAVFPPWWDRAASVQAAMAAGEVVRLGGAPDVVVVRSGAAGLARRLTASGAWLVLDPIVVSGCNAPAEVRHGR